MHINNMASLGLAIGIVYIFTTEENKKITSIDICQEQPACNILETFSNASGNNYIEVAGSLACTDPLK